MSLDKPNEQALLEQLSRFKPPTGTVDPRVAFYEMGYAAALSRRDTTEPAKRETSRWLATAAAIAASVTASFFAGYAIQPAPSRARPTVAEVRQPSGVMQDADASTPAAALAVTQLVAQSEPASPMFSSPRSRAAILSAGLQDSWDHRELNAYGLSAAMPVNRNGTANTGNRETLVSTLTRLDYLTWEDLQ